MNLNDKTVLLTGATGGIGEAIAHTLAQAGAKLILTARNADKLQSLQTSLSGGPHALVVADLSVISEREKLVEQATQAGVDILINNAGINHLQWFAEADADSIDQQIHTNLLVPMQLTRELLPALQQRPEAVIVNMGSILGSIGFAGLVAYSTSKFALRGFSEALRRELADTRVKVLCLAPRATATAIHTDAMTQMNKELGSAVDSPEWVAQQLRKCLEQGRLHNYYLGWPEKLFVRLNGLLPKMVDGSLLKQLPIIKRYARLK